MPCIIWSVRYAINRILVKTRRHSTFNHMKDVKDPEVILADKHFQKSGHRFNKHARFTIT